MKTETHRTKTGMFLDIWDGYMVEDESLTLDEDEIIELYAITGNLAAEIMNRRARDGRNNTPGD